jgi:hypothetical protein
MVAIAPDRAAPPEHAIHGLGHPHREPLTAAGEASRALRLDEEMHMIGLNTEMQEPEGAGGASAECAADGTEEMVPPQRRQPSGGA